MDEAPKEVRGEDLAAYHKVYTCILNDIYTYLELYLWDKYTIYYICMMNGIYLCNQYSPNV